ncbi:MAG: macro domain-containing protein [Bacteroidaceae bacterium]|nr:macro domain-containing protein [Bacteroidaceae bacterium]
MNRLENLKNIIMYLMADEHVSHRIPSSLEERQRMMQGRLLATGDAFITQGYNLPARYVIHTVGPIIPDGIPTKEQEEQLAQCYRSCLDLAEQNGLESIAFCCISTGVFHFPNELAARIAIETVKSYPRHALKTIVFNVFLDKDRNIYQQLLRA